MAAACMGGWCAVRDRCKHHQAENRSKPTERLCEPGTHDAFEPIQRFIPIKEAA